MVDIVSRLFSSRFKILSLTLSFGVVSGQFEEEILSNFASGSYHQLLGISQEYDQRKTLAHWGMLIKDGDVSDIESVFVKELSVKLGTEVRKTILKKIAEDRSNKESPWNDGHHIFTTSNPIETVPLIESLKFCHEAIRYLVSHCPHNQEKFGSERIFELARQLIDR